MQKNPALILTLLIMLAPVVAFCGFEQVPVVFDACSTDTDGDGIVQYSDSESGDFWEIYWEFCLDPGGSVASQLGTGCGIDESSAHLHRLFENDSLVVTSRVFINYTSTSGGEMRIETLLDCGNAGGTTTYIIQIFLNGCCIPTSVSEVPFEDRNWTDVKQLFR